MSSLLLRRSVSLFAVGAGLLAVPLACSSSSGGGKQDFVARYCAEFAPCCAKAGRPSDGAQCRAFLGAFASGSYDASAGDACIAEVHAQASSPTFCDNGGPSGPSCKKVFKDPGGTGGSSAPGTPCTMDSECASSPEGKVRCASVYTAGKTIKKCQVQLPGKAGDSPCVGTIDGNVTSFGSSSSATDVAPRGYLCDLAAGVYCDETSGACNALAPIGGDCSGSFTSGCVREAYCDGTTRKCTARKPTGASCDSFGGQCVAGDTCDSTTKTCVTLLVDGAACNDGQTCASGSCVNGKCGHSSDLGLAFLCGGG